MPPEKAADACSGLEPGRVYRTRDLAAWSTNAPRLARHLVEQGALVPLAHGLFIHPRHSRFGQVPPVDEEVMRAFLGGAPFVFTGPSGGTRWGSGPRPSPRCRRSTTPSAPGGSSWGRTFLLRQDPVAQWL